ncbi:type I restriction-modification system subunit M [Crateriforma conspicua]|uniref:type I restriction-modification system subunit M n=1 Tax=Crateriforma conspicua TaxID=2527996 RepID=UPI00118B85D5|nr:class I SAM-dependent DNA methyltransferase [Crateriforma conspicua]QDV62756.1 Type I restriction enzyme EcoKI M protein [Crateriforma conspicua]
MNQPESHLDKSRLNNLADEIWKSAERLRGKFKAHEYQNVVLPIITIRRLECVLIRWREAKADEIRSKRPKITDDALEKLVKGLELNPAQSPGFSNSTTWTMRKVYEEDHTLLEKNFRAYLKGFSENIQDILDSFDYRAVIGKMVKNARLAPILNQYSILDIGPQSLSSLEMGYIYEELLRRFSEAHAEAAGDHFTPREVIRLMVELLQIPIPTRHTSIYDPACGTGGMLYVAKEHLLDKAKTDKEREAVDKFITLHGTELMAETYAIARSEALIRNETQTTIHWGNSLIPHVEGSKDPGDQFPESKHQFDYMLSNPPFGVTWGGKDGYQTEAEKLESTRYRAGMPSVGDGSLLFLQTILAKMKPAPKKGKTQQGGSKVAIIFNGSPLSNGDCGSGESEIRRWILENDWLDAIVMLPGDLFYNTGIYTYIWLLRNDRDAIGRKGRIMLIDARQQYEKEPKSFGNKRNRIVERHRAWIEDRYHNGWNRRKADDDVRFFTKDDFAFHKVEVVFWQTDENDEPAIITEPFPVSFTSGNVSKKQEFYDSEITFHIRVTSPKTETLHEFDITVGPDDKFLDAYKAEIKDRFGKEMKNFNSSTLNKLEPEVSYTHRHYIKDDEYIPVDPKGDPDKYIPEFLEREIEKQIIRWEDRPQLGYEILPNKYFYKYVEPPKADDLLSEFWKLEEKAEDLLKGLAEEVAQ